jgi:uncharacterized membrane protein YfcA
LNRGLANIRLLLVAGVPYAVFAVIGALLAGYLEETAGDTGDAIIRLALGVLMLGISGLILFAGKRVEYPEVTKVDGITERLALATSYYEESLRKVVSYKIARAPVGIGLFCFVGFISGLFGLGAGWAMVPTLNLVMLAPLKVAAASSKVLIGIGDTAAVWPYMMDGAIFALFAVPCVLGMVIGTVIGAKIMLRVKVGFVRWLVILLMCGAGVKSVMDGITGLT